MKKKIIRLTEEDLVRIVKKVVSEQSNDEFDVNDQLDQLSKMKTVQQSLSEYLPILNKTKKELFDIRDKEMVNQVMRTNETNRSILNNLDGFWNTNVKGTGYEDQYEEPFRIVRDLVQTQKVDGGYYPTGKWLKDMLRLSKSDFQNYIRRMRKMELPDVVGKIKNISPSDRKKIYSMVPTDLKYRVDVLGRVVRSLESNNDNPSVSKPTGTKPKPKPRPSTVQRPK